MPMKVPVGNRGSRVDESERLRPNRVQKLDIWMSVCTDSADAASPVDKKHRPQIYLG